MASQGSGAVVNLGSDAGRAGSSGEAPFVTGQTISVSGGLTMS